MGRWIATLAICALLAAGCAAVSTIAPRDLPSLPEATNQRFLFDSAGGQAEAFLNRPKGKGPFPLMVMLHGHSWVGVGARRLLPAAETFAGELCYATMALSLPG